MIPLRKNALVRRIKEQLAAQRLQAARQDGGKVAAGKPSKRPLGPKLAH